MTVLVCMYLYAYTSEFRMKYFLGFQHTKVVEMGNGLLKVKLKIMRMIFVLFLFSIELTWIDIPFVDS